MLATETGHTSARPPSAPADRRIQEIASDLGRIPAQPAEARDRIIAALTSPDHTPEEWFRLGTTALQAARRDSRRLAETAPASDWNRRLEAEALAGRYPLLARSLNQPRSSAPKPGDEESRLDISREHGALSRARADLIRWQHSPDSPEVLYRRAKALVTISEICYRHAAASPTFEARLFALQALAAEEERDDNAALAEYRAGLAKYPSSAVLHAGLGHLYRARNDLAPARDELAQAWRLDPGDAVVAFELGDVDARLGQLERAIHLLNRALDLDPDLLVAQWSRAKAYLGLGGSANEQLALSDLESAAPCDTTGELQWQLAQLYGKLGRGEQARQAQQRSEEQRRAQESRTSPQRH